MGLKTSVGNLVGPSPGRGAEEPRDVSGLSSSVGPGPVGGMGMDFLGGDREVMASFSPASGWSRSLESPSARPPDLTAVGSSAPLVLGG